MALAAEGVYGGGVVVANLLLLRVVPHTHADVVVACSTMLHSEIWGTTTNVCGENSPPDIKRKLKASNENPLIYLPRSISKGMFAWVRVSFRAERHRK